MYTKSQSAWYFTPETTGIYGIPSLVRRYTFLQILQKMLSKTDCGGEVCVAVSIVLTSIAWFLLLSMYHSFASIICSACIERLDSAGKAHGGGVDATVFGDGVTTCDYVTIQCTFFLICHYSLNGYSAVTLWLLFIVVVTSLTCSTCIPVYLQLYLFMPLGYVIYLLL